jgi:geranylgeranyl pyrophosphate synthase
MRDTSEQFREIGNAASISSQRQDSLKGFFGTSTSSRTAISDDLDAAIMSAPSINNTSNAANKNLPHESLQRATKTP